MKKEEFLELLTSELKRLEEEEHVVELAEKGFYKEIDAIVAEIDYSSIREYEESEEFKLLDISEIYSAKAFVVYLKGCPYNEVLIMESWEDLQEELEEAGGVWAEIADTMASDCINGFDTFEGLVCGEDPEDEEEED